jgi:cold shock CspA family protein
MPKGIVQFFLEKRGTATFAYPKTREEFYVHRRHLSEPVKKGDVVVFDIKENKQGAYAANVRPEKSP